MRKLAICLFLTNVLWATIFGKIQGIVHDPQHRPVAGAAVKLQSATSDWSQTTLADVNGEFAFSAVPVGDYRIQIVQPDFQPIEQVVTVDSNTSRILHFQLAISLQHESALVTGHADTVNADSVTPTRSSTAPTSPKLPARTAPTAWR